MVEVADDRRHDQSDGEQRHRHRRDRPPPAASSPSRAAAASTAGRLSRNTNRAAGAAEPEQQRHRQRRTRAGHARHQRRRLRQSDRHRFAVARPSSRRAVRAHALGDDQADPANRQRHGDDRRGANPFERSRRRTGRSPTIGSVPTTMRRSSRSWPLPPPASAPAPPAAARSRRGESTATHREERPDVAGDVERQPEAPRVPAEKRARENADAPSSRRAETR